MELRENQRVELWVGGRAYPVRVEEVGPGRVLLSAPMERGRPFFPPTGTRVRGRLYGEGGAWEFEGSVTECVRLPVEAVCVRLAGPLRPVDRRALPRRRMSARVYVARLDQHPTRLVEAWLVDLSAGGCRLELVNPWPEPRPTEQVLVTVPGRAGASLVGRVVWSRPQFDRGRHFSVGVQWDPASAAAARRVLETREGMGWPRG
ncbi:MAG: flagellar brake protein [Armatimonadota bacterium]|nr:flagellar brake protein [Armatimonadota bacterium]MDR7444895.1 flagellar brake protein [Armatimonadota bacterium]MDR7569114.1 flagellar brake protein [Armatimonadota bacterium]MDR7613440.1 flagellar brake protein [Armatimonadota bacterium]